MTNTISSLLLIPLFKTLSDENISIERFIRNISFDLCLSRVSDIRLTTTQLLECYETVADLTNDPFIGLKIGKSSTLSSYGLTGQIVSNSKTVREMFENYFKYHPILCDTLHFQLKEYSEICSIKFISNGILSANHIFCDVILSTLINNITNYTGKEVTTLSISYTSIRPNNIRKYREYFKITPTFNQESNCVIFPSKLLDSKLLFYNENLQIIIKKEADKILEKYKLNKPWTYKIKSILFSNKEVHTFSIEDTASELNVSYRYLQEQLKKEGSTYRGILKEYRLNTAKHFLTDRSKSITQISTYLGFSDSASFGHFFKKHTNETPGNYRKQNKCLN